jgi:hypothetical protein
VIEVNKSILKKNLVVNLGEGEKKLSLHGITQHLSFHEFFYLKTAPQPFLHYLLKAT